MQHMSKINQYPRAQKSISIKNQHMLCYDTYRARENNPYLILRSHAGLYAEEFARERVAQQISSSPEKGRAEVFERTSAQKTSYTAEEKGRSGLSFHKACDY